MTIQEKIARDLRIQGPFTTHDTEIQAQEQATKTGGEVMAWTGTYAAPADKGPIAISLTIWICS